MTPPRSPRPARPPVAAAAPCCRTRSWCRPCWRWRWRWATRSCARSCSPSRTTASPSSSAGLRSGSALNNYRTLVADGYLWRVTLRSIAFCLVNAALTMAIGVGLALLMRHMSRGRTPPRADRAAAGVGDAGGRLAHGVAVALRHAVRRRELRPDRARPRLRGPRVAPAAAVLLLRRDRDRRVDERAVRRVHRLRRAHPGARGADRGRRDRRRRSGLTLPPRRAAHDPPGAARRRAAADHLGPARLHRRSTSSRRPAAAPATPTCSAPTSTGSASAAASSAWRPRWRSSCSPSPSC